MNSIESLPIDPNNYAVRDYLALTRLQVLTPLSLVISIATVGVCSMVVSPSLGAISRLHPTAISPNTAAIGTYILVIYLMQVGYCVLLVLATKPETKKALVQATGMPLVISNFVMALWAISWVMQWFLFSTILQAILLLLLLYSNIALLVYHAPVSSRPLDTAFIHTPIRFFCVLPLSLLLPLSLFLTLGFSFTPTPPGPPVRYSAWHTWPAFGIVVGTNIICLIVLVLRRDMVLTVAATWICVSIWTSTPKPAPVYGATIAFTALHPLAYFVSEIYHRFYKTRRVQLENDNEHPGLYRRRTEEEERRVGGENEGGPRQVDEDQVWS